MTSQPMQARADWLAKQVPDLVAEVTLYSSDQGGRKGAAVPGWGCPCSLEMTTADLFYDGWPILSDWIHPGETRRVGWVFPIVGADVMKQAKKFYLWEGKFIGEARVVNEF